VGVVGFGLGDLLAREEALRDRVDAPDALGHVLVGDALDFQGMQPGEIRDLVERERGVFDQPNGGRLRHQDGHGIAPDMQKRPASSPGARGPEEQRADRAQATKSVAEAYRLPAPEREGVERCVRPRYAQKLRSASADFGWLGSGWAPTCLRSKVRTKQM